MWGDTAVVALGMLMVSGAALLPPSREAPKAKGVLHDSAGAEVGTVEAEPVGGGLRVIVKVEKMPPGDHGVHIHAAGSCNAAGSEAFADAGPHFDPGNTNRHAGLNGDGHAGDLGNIQVGGDGKGKLDVVAHNLDLAPGKGDVMGKSLIVHAKSDNLTDKPEGGGSDGRLACAVLEQAK